MAKLFFLPPGIICSTSVDADKEEETLILPVIPIFNIKRKNFCYLLKVIELKRAESPSKVTSVDADKEETETSPPTTALADSLQQEE